MNSKLTAQKLTEDSRVLEAKKLLLNAVRDHQKELTGVRPSIAEHKESYAELLNSFAEMRGGPLWHPYIGSGIGKGCLVELMDGSVKYDFICGIGPHFLGHSNPDIISAVIDASISNTVLQGHLQQNADSVELSKMLLKLSNMDHCFLTTSGAMANENALKLALQKRSPANRILAFEHCFAGRTITLSQITDKPSFREGLPSTVFVDYIPFYDASCPVESTERALKVLKQYISHHPKEYALMLFELVQGESGFYPGSHDFFKALMVTLREHSISVFVDEVQTFGRTPSLFTFQYFHLEEYVDIVSIGKLAHVCATLFKKDHKPRPGLLSQTFTSSTAAIRVAIMVLKYLSEGGFYGPNGKIVQLHQNFESKLQELAKKYPELISGPFGIGAMIAFTPYNGDTHHVTKFVHALFEAGVIGFIAGNHPTRCRFLVPAITSQADIDGALKIVEETLLSQK